MGSIEVYDHKNHKWVPYVPDYEKWLQHFRDMAEGRVRPDHKGRYIVGSGNKKSEERTINMVTPVAQSLEMAKSEIDEIKKTTPKVIRGSASKRKRKHPITKAFE